MEEFPYATEEVLQELLARYPDLLPGEQITPENPRRWLLVAREVGVPGEEGGAGQWSLDHLFLDQDGIPTFVECKRATDTRNRREVVAQMLDYAANGTAYWSMDRLRQSAAEAAEARLDETVAQLLDDPEADLERYWDQVEANLRSGRVRLVFVADSSPPELRRLVEFLNEKMADVEVLAVEIRQYLSGDHKVVVPRVIGLTEAARQAKSSSPQRRLDRHGLLARSEPTAGEFYEHVLDQAQDRGHSLYWGLVSCSVGVILPDSGARATFVYCTPPNKFEVYLGHLHQHGALSDEQALELRKLLTDTGIFTEEGKHTIRCIVDETRVAEAIEAYALVLDRVDDLAAGRPVGGRLE